MSEGVRQPLTTGAGTPLSQPLASLSYHRCPSSQSFSSNICYWAASQLIAALTSSKSEYRRAKLPLFTMERGQPNRGRRGTQPDVSLFLQHAKDALGRPKCPQSFGFSDSNYAERFENVWTELAPLLGTWAQHVTTTAKNRQVMLKRCKSCWTSDGFPKDCLMQNVVRVPSSASSAAVQLSHTGLCSLNLLTGSRSMGMQGTFMTCSKQLAAQSVESVVCKR